MERNAIRLMELVGAVALAACGTRADVLSERQGLGLEEQGDPQWTTCSNSLFESSAQTGDSCGQGSGAGGGGGGFINGCGNACSSIGLCDLRGYRCESGTMRVTSATVLDCDTDDGAPVGADPEAQWSDCEAALGGGNSGDSCQGSWLCARDASRTCCVEVAECARSSNSDAFRLVRYRVCSPGCGTVEPLPEAPVVHSCAEAAEAGTGPGQPCEGSFVCVGAQDVLAAPLSFDPPIERSAGADCAQPTEVSWCDEGTIQVAYEFGRATEYLQPSQ